jgi:DNA repair exonuclease SbcCD nuclease subunit
MAKVAIITDTHLGARDGRAVFHDFFEKFYRDVFFPTCKQYGVVDVLHGGDLFDRRKYIDYFSLKRSKDYFFSKMEESGMKMYTLVGNHDIPYRNTLSANSPELLLTEYKSIIPISSPKVINVGVDVAMIPWICADNYDESTKLIKTTAAPVCLGHFEIKGFAMYRGMESHEGFDTGMFKRFDLVMSGHYHHRSSRDNIHYLGNPYEITWQDCADTRGFHILDTEKMTLEFIKNPYTLFERVIYDDVANIVPDVTKLKEKFVKLVVQKKTDYYKFDLFLDKLYNCGAHDIKISEDLAEISQEELDEKVDIEDTLSILEHFIQESDASVDKSKLTTYVKNLYTEAINVVT